MSDSFVCSGQGGLSALQNNIPGEPGVDYPIYTLPPLTGFDCDGRVSLILKRRKPVIFTYHVPLQDLDIHSVSQQMLWIPTIVSMQLKATHTTQQNSQN